MRKSSMLLLLFALTFLTSFVSAQTTTVDLNYLPKTAFNDKIVGSSTAENGTTFEKIVLDGYDSKIPFYRITPKQKKEDTYVFLLHGITGSKDNWINPTSSLSEKYVRLKDSLLTLGYTVIIPDAKYHGERSYEGNFASPVTFFSSQDFQKAHDLFTTTVKDIRIVMDYLQSNSGDSITTFNVIGYSMGGMVSIRLNSIDDRLNCVVVCVAPLDGQKSSARLGMNEENAKSMDALSPKNYATLQKAPITLLMGTEDWWYTKEEAQAFYDTIVLTDKSLKFYESGHFLPTEFVADAIKSIHEE